MHILASAQIAKRSWLQAVRADLVWMSMRSSEWKNLEEAPIAKWVDLCFSDSKRFCKHVIAICSEPANNLKSSWAQMQAEVDIGNVYACAECGYRCTTLQKLSVHQFREHGVIRDVRRFVDTKFCCACLQFFHARERLICHLTEKSKRCKLFYLHCLPRLDDASFCAMEEEGNQECKTVTRDGNRRAKAQKAVVRMCGPYSASAELFGISHKNCLKCAW